MFGANSDHADSHAELRQGLEGLLGASALSSSSVSDLGVSKHRLVARCLSLRELASVASVVSAAYPAGSGHLAVVGDALVVTASRVAQRASKRRSTEVAEADDDATLARLAQLDMPPASKQAVRRHVSALRALRSSDNEEAHVKTVIETRLIVDKMRIVVTTLLAGGISVSLRSLAAATSDLDGAVATRVAGETSSVDDPDLLAMCTAARSSRSTVDLGLSELVVVVQC
jgi:hypothetical protein